MIFTYCVECTEVVKGRSGTQVQGKVTEGRSAQAGACKTPQVPKARAASQLPVNKYTIMHMHCKSLPHYLNKAGQPMTKRSAAAQLDSPFPAKQSPLSASKCCFLQPYGRLKPRLTTPQSLNAGTLVFASTPLMHGTLLKSTRA